MKKNKATQTWLMAIAALLVGFLIGYSINNLPPAGDDVAGSIGKLDRYRNVKVSEADMLLRNELIEDTLKRNQYQQYLMYYYYQSLRTATDAQQVLNRTTSVEDFNKLYYPYADALGQYSQYLDAARNDILEALTLIVSLDDNESLPVINYLNQAQNAIARIRHHDAILMNYMHAIAAYIDEHKLMKNDSLEEAHDILLLNLANGAILTQNKPILYYLDKQQFLSSRDGRKQLNDEASLNAFNQQFMLDVEMLGIDFPCICNMEELSALMYANMEQLEVIFGEEQLGRLLSNENLGAFLANEQLMASHPQLMGNIESLNAINSMDMLQAH